MGLAEYMVAGFILLIFLAAIGIAVWKAEKSIEHVWNNVWRKRLK